jgi:hypothetical protein
MSRIPPKPREELAPEQHEIHDLFDSVAYKSFGPNGEQFIYEENGAFIGPFPFFMAAPEVGKGLLSLVVGMQKLGLPPDARETAILAVGARFQAGYETYSHIPQAVVPGYLTQQQAEAIVSGEKPNGLNENCSVAYDVANRLSGTPGPLPQDLWDRTVELLGKDATVGLLHYIGFYCYVCVALNAVDAKVPA